MTNIDDGDREAEELQVTIDFKHASGRRAGNPAKNNAAYGEDVCDVNCINPEAVEAVRRQMINEGAASDLAGLFRVMGDPTRLRIISLLAASELCVCDIAAALEMTQSAVSHQLRVLRMMKLVKFRKEGRAAYYSLDDDHVERLYILGLDHLGHADRDTGGGSV